MIDRNQFIKPNRPILSAFFCITIAISASCVGGSGSAANVGQRQTTSPESQVKSAIRNVDFKNFVYSKLPTGKCSMNEVRLIDGRYSAPADIAGKRPAVDCWSVVLGPITYGDVTGDGNEEAMVELYAEAGGTDASEDIYTYTLEGNNPRLLWKFATGDRADGGLRRIAAENGEMVVDLFGVGTAIGKKLYGTEDVGACCPKHYTRTKYRWDGTQFQQQGAEMIVENPGGGLRL